MLAHRKPVDVFDGVEGAVTVLKRKPAGTVVKKREWVVEFDRTDRRDALAGPEVGVRAAEAAYQTARMNREVGVFGVQGSSTGSRRKISSGQTRPSRATAARLGAEERAGASRSAEGRRVLTEARIAEKTAKARKAILFAFTGRGSQPFR